jgi:hypothetical protein
MPRYYDTAELTQARAIRTQRESENIALRTSILRGDHINREALTLALRDVMLAVKQIIESSKNLNQAEKIQLLTELTQIPAKLKAEKPSKPPRKQRKPKVETTAPTCVSDGNGAGQ